MDNHQQNSTGPSATAHFLVNFELTQGDKKRSIDKLKHSVDSVHKLMSAGEVATAKQKISVDMGENEGHTDIAARLQQRKELSEWIAIALDRHGDTTGFAIDSRAPNGEYDESERYAGLSRLNKHGIKVERTGGRSERVGEIEAQLKKDGEEGFVVL